MRGRNDQGKIIKRLAVKSFHEKLEKSPMERHLSREERLKMQIDIKNIIIDYNIILGKGTNATVYKGK